jgi:hypothetical protein
MCEKVDESGSVDVVGDMRRDGFERTRSGNADGSRLILGVSKAPVTLTLGFILA